MIRLLHAICRTNLPTALLLCICLAAAAYPRRAQAHPHVWVVAEATLIFDDAGNLTALHHRWTFDKPYSSYITTGLDINRDGKLTEKELSDLAGENTLSLIEFGYFTKLKIHGTEQEFGEPRNYRMTFEGGSLIQHFDLPLKKPVKAPKIIGLEIYDVSYFVAFTLADTDDAVTLAGSAKGCATTVTRPRQADMNALSQLSEDYFANAGMGLQYANKAVIACP